MRFDRKKRDRRERPVTTPTHSEKESPATSPPAKRSTSIRPTREKRAERRVFTPERVKRLRTELTLHCGGVGCFGGGGGLCLGCGGWGFGLWVCVGFLGKRGNGAWFRASGRKKGKNGLIHRGKGGRGNCSCLTSLEEGRGKYRYSSMRQERLPHRGCALQKGEGRRVDEKRTPARAQ